MISIELLDLYAKKCSSAMDLLLNTSELINEVSVSEIENKTIIFDALSAQFVRAYESIIKLFRTLEYYEYNEKSETKRSMLSKMEKLDFITSVAIWMEMGDVRNKMAHDYIPEEQFIMFKEIFDTYLDELKSSLDKTIDFIMKKSRKK